MRVFTRASEQNKKSEGGSETVRYPWLLTASLPPCKDPLLRYARQRRARGLRVAASARAIALAAAACLMLAAAPAYAQSADQPSQSVTVNLIRLLVKQGVITQKAGEALLKQAEAEAEQARAKTASVAQAVPVPAPPPPGTIRVPYVPEIVKKQIRDEVKDEVLAEAKAENWAKPEIVPSWTKRIRIFGDFNIRDQSNFYGANNIGSDGLDGFVNFAAFNSTGPIQVNPNVTSFNPPILDTTQDRVNQLILRARFGLFAQIADDVGLTLRLDTGQDNGPLSTTQLFGGGFAKKDIWLGLGYIDLKPFPEASIDLGRMPDPFMATDLVFYDRLSFDGVAWQARTKPRSDLGWGVFETLGAFPIGYIDANFPTNSVAKSPDRTEWLLGGQLGGEWTTPDFNWDTAVAIYYYVDAQGELSAPCAIYLGAQQCSSDDTRPPFMQKGNTLFLIRNVVPDPNNPTTYSQPQFAGLSYNYHELDATTSFDLKTGFSGYHLILDADYVRNLAYDPGVAFRNCQVYGVTPITNFNAPPPTTSCAAAESYYYKSGPNAFMGRVTFGDPVIKSRWDWKVAVGYKYLQPDAVLDAFTDSDFHLGGTNAKGYFLKASLGVFDNTWLSAQWYSADQVYGAPLAIDVLQFDLNTSF